MKIYLHVGNYKTGTTAVQTFLFGNREKLADCGYFVPLAGRVGDAHHAWAASLLGRPGGTDPDALYREINEELNACGSDKAIVSTETFFNGKVASELVKRLAGHEIVVIAYLRRQDEFASAFYMQLVKHPNFMESSPPDIRRFMRKEGAADYLNSLTHWAAAVGENSMIVRPYECEQLPEGLIPDFLDCIGIGASRASEFTAASSVNVTIETELIEFLRIANGLGLSKNEHAMLLHALTEISRRGDKSELLHKRNVFSPEERRMLLEALEEENEELARTFLGRPDGRLFYAPPPSDDTTWTPMALSVESLAQIISALWILQQGQLADVLAVKDREFNDRLTNFLNKMLQQERDRLTSLTGKATEFAAKKADPENQKSIRILRAISSVTNRT